ncbi:PIN-like domain-containing protein [Brachybacterium sp. UNK5269]|uniref:PIN-like domain-containing protein n=1 Tax=Brachybacterium sp. UNK5269 TaxID=3408576 RepID=UPI003BB2156B
MTDLGSSSDRSQDALNRTFAVLNRDIPFHPIQHLSDNLKRAQESRTLASTSLNLDSNVAIGLDTNALFRLGMNGSSGADAVDYLASIHKAPLIIPGQVAQEVWNNALSAVQPNAKSLKSAIDKLIFEAEKLDRDLGPRSEGAIDASSQFAQWHGDWIDESNQKALVGTLENLSSRAISKSVSRTRFSALAQIRNDTKTPPGFSDHNSNHGDFYVWADFLYGLAESNLEGVQGVLFVTEDQKPDWSRAGVAHPTLSAEIEALTGLPFSLCSLKGFYRLVKDASK